ncbi:choice-of-anchor Q domain-containing protein [Planctomycetota bacterium]
MSSHIVIYNNTAHDFGDWQYALENDAMGVAVGGFDASDVWIVDNELFHMGGDSIRVGTGDTPDPEHPATMRNAYIGRNRLYENGENAIDLKPMNNVVISENIMYGFDGNSGDRGTAVVIHNEPNNTWIIDNIIYDAVSGIAASDAHDVFVIGNVFYNVNDTLEFWYDNEIHFINNIVSGMEYGILDRGVNTNPHPIVNNIFTNLKDGGYHIQLNAAADNSLMQNNLIYESDGTFRVKWDGATYTSLEDFQSSTGKGEGCIVDNPQFLDSENNDFRLQPTSPAIDNGTSIDYYTNLFITRFGVDIAQDISGTARPQGLAWDIGAYEYVPGLALFLSSTSGGIVANPGEGYFPYNEGTVVTIEARADDDYYFVNWTGTAVDAGKVANPNAANTTVTVDGAYTIQANFNTDKHTLTISSTGGGSVTDPGEGNFLYDDETVVPIQATAGANYHFVNWTGTAVDEGQVANPNSAGTTVTMEGDYTLQANFAIDQHDLTTSSTSGGSVTTPGEGTYSYDHGTAAPIVAAPAANYHFVNWTGTAVDDGKVANPNAASTTVTVDADYAVQANFAMDKWTLTFSSTIGGSVTVPGEGDFPYDHGTFVAINAVAEDNYRFVNWTGTAVDAGKVVNPNTAATSVTADADYTVQANFGEQDGAAPTVTNLSPSAGDTQVSLNNLIILHVTDAGIGVDAGSVKITLDGVTIYEGDKTYESSTTGICRRTGTPADFTYVYQSSQNFEFDEIKTITVDADDLGGDGMTQPYSYSFTTEMRSFGQNKQVDPIVTGLDKAGPSTARDSSGNIWAVWYTGPIGSRDIYIAKRAAGADAFGASLPLISHSADQSNPALAVGADDRLYVVWQDNRQADDNNQGEWDIYISTSSGGVTWSIETRVNDPNENNQINPAIVVDSNSPNNNAHVVWQDDRAGHQDICIASSSNGFTTKTVSQQITNDPSNQNRPAIAVDASNTVYVLWTDARNPTNGHDIYGAASNAGPWTNVPVVTKEANQSSPVIAVESTGSILHMLWVDQTSGDSGIYYDSSDGLPGGALPGSNLIDGYAKGKGQFSPAIAVTGSAGNDLKVFACWRDERNVASAGDTDIWFVRANSGSGKNVFVGDGGTNSNQIEPAIGIDQYEHPYIVWTDYRGTNTEIYCAASTYMRPTALASGQVTPTSGDVTIGIDPGSIAAVDDVSVVVPAGACPYDATITITELLNPPEFPPGGFGICYDLGPSGLEFNASVTITIPHHVSDCPGLPIYRVYWYDPQIGDWSPVGGISANHEEKSPTMHAVTFETTHFTSFGVSAIASSVGGGGGGGGGCALSHSKDGSIVEYFLPYGVLALFMIVLKWRDRKYRAHSGKRPSS